MDAAQRIRQLGDWLAGTDIAVLELSTPGTRLRLDRGTPPATEARAAAPTTAMASMATQTTASSGKAVKAQSVGVFLDTHPLAAEPLAPVGARVAAGQVLGLLRIGALLLPVTAPADAVVGRVLATPGAAVGYGTALFDLDDPNHPK
jgi:acetyl-CoA carboxylase biotin carboxyl carrier protein